MSCVSELFQLIIPLESVSVFSQTRYLRFFSLSNGLIRARNLPRAPVTTPRHSTQFCRLLLHSLPQPLSARSGAGSRAHTRVSVSRTTILRRYTADTLTALLSSRRSSQLTFKNSAVLSGRMLGMWFALYVMRNADSIIGQGVGGKPSSH